MNPCSLWFQSLQLWGSVHLHFIWSFVSVEAWLMEHPGIFDTGKLNSIAGAPHPHCSFHLINHILCSTSVCLPHSNSLGRCQADQNKKKNISWHQDRSFNLSVEVEDTSDSVSKGGFQNLQVVEHYYLLKSNAANSSSFLLISVML